MYSTVTFEGNLAADVEVKENKAGGVYVDAVVLVNQGKDSDRCGSHPDPLAGPDHRPHRRERRQPAQGRSAAGHRFGGHRLLGRQADRRGALRHPGPGPVGRGRVDLRPGHRHRAQHPHRRLTHLPGSRSPRGRDPTTPADTRPTESRNPLPEGAQLCPARPLPI